MSLFLFTASFPFGINECFLEEEVSFLCREFDEVVIIPLVGYGTQVRIVPPNCRVLQPVIKSRFQQYTRGLFCYKSIHLYVSDFIDKKVFLSLTRLEEWFVSLVLTNNLLKSKEIKDVFSRICEEDVCLFYWGKGPNLLSVFFPNKAKYVSRFHGEWDLWEESCGNYAPCRKVVADSLDFAVFISKKGESYFKTRYPNCRTVVFPLGTIDYGGTVKKEHNNVLHVVSCSTVYSLKRVPLIFEALNSMTSYSIEWTHIGGGKDFGALKHQVGKEANSHLSVILTGGLNHDKVVSYYKEHHFDVFINLSTNEGVPVSIMEAISFDIPVVATDVGGTSEVVTDESGVLVSANPSCDEVAKAIQGILSAEFHPRLFWEKHYSASFNYTAFAKFLKEI